MWIGLVSTCSSADRVSEGGGILMSRPGLLFGTRSGAEALLILNILLKHLFILIFPSIGFFSRSYLGALGLHICRALTGAVMEG